MTKAIMNCDWQIGTVWSRSKLCGKNAKFTATDSTGRTRRLCGIHRRAFARINDESTIKPIANDAKE